MALLRKLFYRKPPDGLFEICERVYVFDCCFTTDAWKEENYKVYIAGAVGQLQEHLPDASFLVFNFHDGMAQSQMAGILSEYDMTIMDYPRHFEGCPVLTMELIHHFLRSSESWLGLGHNNVLLMHCERGGWPVLAFMLAALLIYRKHYTGEHRTLDMVYRQAPLELLHLLSALNPIPSQLRYLQYVSRRNVALEWPPLDRALTLDCVIFRFIPNFDGQGGCRPIFRIYGQDPFLVTDRTAKVLYSTPKRSKTIRPYKQAECELVKIDINCHIQGDVVLECISLHNDMEREQMMFRVMFNTAFIRSNILMLNRDEIDMLWDVKEQFPKDFRVEILFSEMDAVSSIILGGMSCFEDKEGLPMEAFDQVQEIFSYVDWLDPKTDAALNVLQQLGASNITHEKLDTDSSQESIPKQMPNIKTSLNLENDSKILASSEVQSVASPDTSVSKQEAKPQDVQRPNQCDSVSQHMPQPPQSEPMKAFAQVQEIISQVPSTTQSPDSTVTKPEAKQDIHTAQQPPNQSDSVSQQRPQPPMLTPMEAFIQVQDIFSRVASPKKSQDTTVNKQEAIPQDTYTASQPHIPQPSKSIPVSSGAQSVSVAPPTPPPASPLQPTSAMTTPPPPPSPPLQPQHASLPKPKDALSKDTETQPSSPGRIPPSSSPVSKVTSSSQPPPPPPPPSTPPLKENLAASSRPPPPPPPPLHSGKAGSTANASPVPVPPAPPSAPPPPPPPLSGKSGGTPVSSPSAPPPPPAPFAKGGSKPGTPPPPPVGSASNAKGRLSRTINSKDNQKKLKPLHWLKLSRAVQGSLWAEAEKSSEDTKAPEIDMSELENLFAAAVPTSDQGKKGTTPGPVAPKSDKVQLIDHRRAYNCEIMLSKVKVPLHELTNSVLALENTALDPDQVENLIKFCPTKEEMELLKGYKGEKEKLGKCEQFLLELMKVPRVESKLRVFSFKIQFSSQVSDLRKSLNVVNSAAEEIRNSGKLKRVMQTILSLGNALNQGTARGAAIGFRLDSLLKLIDTRARNNKMTLMHYLCKVLADQLPEVLDFSKDLSSLEPASKIQLKFLAEEMQAVSKGLEKVVQELSTSENDGPISKNFRKTLKEFLRSAEAEVRSLALLYSSVGRNVDALILYFGEDPAKCPFEQVISTLLNFVRMFIKSHDENCKQSELEMKKAAESEKVKMGASNQSERVLRTPIHNSNVK
ncbi:formin-like protein 18 isoform X1 [Rosa rugosa]|uniref:formin-like protein 18 isoform X1 n=1 Tax=Rosa rugosa TaxID=74645 RepID=UPI002B40DEBA|nr:formin-like protein 18 isoform X1 [Rosa rugosa]